MIDHLSRQAAIIEMMDNNVDHVQGIDGREIVQILEDIPAADVVPVVHGKWLKEDRGHVEYDAVCSVCGFDWMWSDRGYFNFCPNCGADMRGDEHD